MPPQSRGPSPERSFAKAASLPPTLRPYLENLPSPTALIPGDQRTPTGPRMIIPDRDNATPTPTPTAQRRARSTTAFQLGSDEQDGQNDEDQYTEGEQADNADDVAGVTLTDDDFESHYSRQDSSASEDEDGSDDYEDDHEEDDPNQNGNNAKQNGAAGPGGNFPSSSDRPDSLSRVRSLPARPLPHVSQVNSQQYQSSGLHTSQSTTSLPPVPPPLYPPFYNRPPTPLPPSPSLTSLLRPPSLLNRSTTSTRPTTPDSSDVETPNDTEAAVAHSARRAHPLPPTPPKVPTYEYYGFVLYLASSLGFLIYILWSYLPSPFLHALGVTYYPNRWWSLAIPAWIVILLIFIYVALLSYNVEYLTLPLTSMECMVDEAGNVAIVDEYGRVRKGGSKKFVKELEERAKLQKEMESKGKGKGKGKGKRSSGSGSGPSKQANRNRRRMNETAGGHQVQSPLRNDPPEIPARFSYPSSTPMSALPHQYANQPNAQPNSYSYQERSYGNALYRRLSDAEYPNWRLVWNEGTDAVMDIPIGGVCEVLYGGDGDGTGF